MPSSLQQSRFARVALLSTLATAGLAATTVGAANAGGDTITDPPRPTHSCFHDYDAYGCVYDDGSGFACFAVGTPQVRCIEWDSDGNTNDW